MKMYLILVRKQKTEEEEEKTAVTAYRRSYHFV